MTTVGFAKKPEHRWDRRKEKLTAFQAGFFDLVDLY